MPRIRECHWFPIMLRVILNTFNSFTVAHCKRHGRHVTVFLSGDNCKKALLAANCTQFTYGEKWEKSPAFYQKKSAILAFASKIPLAHQLHQFVLIAPINSYSV
ncbi:hypothetical protein ECG_03187 [Echinococcus granulosus]|nr:hypothetical protein ECG_03187 [Echinococcus granulosus]